MEKLVVLDAGHGGHDLGAEGNQLREKDLTLSICQQIAQVLGHDYRVSVTLTRSTDVFLSLAERSSFANRSRADYFVSIHVNKGGGEGYEDYIQAGLPDTSPAAVRRSAIHAEVMEVLLGRGVRDRGEKKKNLHVLRETHMPAVLTENLFIDDSHDAGLLRRPTFLNELAEAHARGIARALGLRWRRTTVTPNARLLAKPRVTVSRVERYLLSRPHGEYPDRSVRRIASLYFDTAELVGVDPLVVISQMVLETANLSSHWSQRPRRNPAGIGVTGAPGVGISFPSWSKAVRAHVGRLLAYALPRDAEDGEQRALIEEALSWRPLPDDRRGVAPRLSGLAGTWALDPQYADKISRIANEIRNGE
jgi:N-acetylmuramoyl-L-alanine amidase